MEEDNKGDIELEPMDDGSIEIEVPRSAESKFKLTSISGVCSNKKLSTCGTVVKFFIPILLFGLLASNIVLWNNWYERKTYSEPTELEITAEFQIFLIAHDWTNRDQQLNDFFYAFQQISGYPFLDNDILENYRVQTHIHADECHPDWDVDFRLRNYYYGPSTGTSTLDVKIGSIDYDEGLIAPLEPSDDQLEHSFQKLERDIHPCDEKYSRESRVQDIPYEPVYTTCKDLRQLYPYIWSEKYDAGKLNSTEESYWYTGVYNGIFPNGVSFKSDVTLEYESIDDVASGRAVPKSGEYSLRIWSTHLGHGPWDDALVDEITGWYRQLLDSFPSSGYPCK